MASLSEFSEALNRAIGEIESTAMTNQEKITHDLLALISSRVINHGVDSQGAKFSSYSTNPLPTYYFLPSSNGKKKTTKSDDRKSVSDFRKRYGNDTSYKNWREFHGLPTDIKNFSFTNEMWKAMTVVPISSSIGQNTFGITASKDPEREIMFIHHAKYGFLLPSASELDLVKAANNERVVKILEKWLKV